MIRTADPSGTRLPCRPGEVGITSTRYIALTINLIAARDITTAKVISKARVESFRMPSHVPISAPNSALPASKGSASGRSCATIEPPISPAMEDRRGC